MRILSAQLRRAGIELVPTYVPGSPLFQSVLPSGDFDLALFSWNRPSDEPGVNQILRCGGSQNFTGYCQRLVTRDLDEAEHVLDVEQRARVLNRVDARVALDVPLLPSSTCPVVGAARSTVRGYTPPRPPSTRSSARRTGGSRGASGGARRRAPRPVPGAGGAPGAETPRRGGTVDVGTVREPPCLNAYLLKCGDNVDPGNIMRLALRGAFEVGPGFR